MERIILIGDSHFGSFHEYLKRTEEERKKQFFKVLRDYASNSHKLILMGDIFDFWFEYKLVIPDYAYDVLMELERVSKDVEVFYLRGNHDLWANKKLETFGVKVVDFLKLDFKGEELLFIHGHQLTKSKSTRLLHKLFVFKPTVALYSLLHPDWGISMAGRISEVSREFGRYGEPDEKNTDIREIGTRFAFLAHYHKTGIYSLGGKFLIVCTEWIKDLNFSILYGEGVKIYNFPSKRVVEELKF